MKGKKKLDRSVKVKIDKNLGYLDKVVLNPEKVRRTTEMLKKVRNLDKFFPKAS